MLKLKKKNAKFSKKIYKCHHKTFSSFQLTNPIPIDSN